MRYRPLFWVFACLLLAVAAVLAYSPNPARRRHILPLSLTGGSLFVLGWAVSASATVGDI